MTAPPGKRTVSGGFALSVEHRLTRLEIGMVILIALAGKSAGIYDLLLGAFKHL